MWPLNSGNTEIPPSGRLTLWLHYTCPTYTDKIAVDKNRLTGSYSCSFYVTMQNAPQFTGIEKGKNQLVGNWVFFYRIASWPVNESITVSICFCP